MMEPPMIAMNQLHQHQHFPDDEQSTKEEPRRDDSEPRNSIMDVLHKLTEVGPNNELDHKPKLRIERTNIHKILSEQCLFDSIGSQFNVFVFFHQLLFHMLFPLMLLLPNPPAQAVRLNWVALQYSLLHPIVFYAMIISYLSLSASDHVLLGYSVLLPMMFFISHRCMISLK